MDPAEHSHGWVDDSVLTFEAEIAALTFSGGRTAIGLGLAQGLSILLGVPGRESHAQAMVVVTDGNDNEASNYLAEADRARSAGIAVFAVGITDRVGDQTLLDIAGGLQGNVFRVDDFDGLNSALVGRVRDSIAGYCDLEMALELLVGPLELTNAAATVGTFEPIAKGINAAGLTWVVGEAFGTLESLSFELPVCDCAYSPSVPVHSSISLRFGELLADPAPAAVEEAASLVIEVVDDIPPTITCPNNVLVEKNTCISPIAEIVVPNASANDNCGIGAITQVGGPTTLLGMPHSFPVGHSVIELSVMDLHGLSANCSFSITVTDSGGGVTGCPFAPPTPAPSPTPAPTGPAAETTEHSVIAGRIIVAVPECTADMVEAQEGSATHQLLVGGINTAFGADDAVVKDIACADQAAGTTRSRRLASSGGGTLTAQFSIDYYTNAESTAAVKASRGVSHFVQYSTFERVADSMGVDVQDLSVDQIGYSQVSEKRTLNTDESSASGQSISPLIFDESRPGLSTTLLVLFFLCIAWAAFTCLCGCMYLHRKRQLRSRLEEWHIIRGSEQGAYEPSEEGGSDSFNGGEHDSLCSSYPVGEEEQGQIYSADYAAGYHDGGKLPGAPRLGGEVEQGECLGTASSGKMPFQTLRVDIGGLDYDDVHLEGEDAEAQQRPLSRRFSKEVVEAAVRKAAGGIDHR
jgi:hypothetical protein